MQRDLRTEVLVAGAGPAGMLAALVLAKGGVHVRVIDRDPRTTSRTYACALHPQTLELLSRLGLGKEIHNLGRKIESVAFYQDDQRRAELSLARLSPEFPFVLVLPQSAFEKLLEEALKRETHVRIEWNHQLSNLRPERDGILATVDTLAISAKGYGVPDMDWAVTKSEEILALFVVGAEGPNSFVRKELSIESETVGHREFFAVYEFSSDISIGNELRVVLAEDTTSVLWPLPDGRFRWSFQLLEEHLADFPSKDRASILIGDPEAENENRKFIERLVRDRAPWFNGQIQEVGWSTDVEFEHRVAKQFGVQRGWLCGDAAHQTGPAGMQSMNLGLSEAEMLATLLARIIKHQSPLQDLESYSDRYRAEWQKLLGLSPAFKASTSASPWVKSRASRILGCLPISGKELRLGLKQLGLELD